MRVQKERYRERDTKRGVTEIRRDGKTEAGNEMKPDKERHLLNQAKKYWWTEEKRGMVTMATACQKHRLCNSAQITKPREDICGPWCDDHTCQYYSPETVPGSLCPSSNSQTPRPEPTAQKFRSHEPFPYRPGGQRRPPRCSW